MISGGQPGPRGGRAGMVRCDPRASKRQDWLMEMGLGILRVTSSRGFVSLTDYVMTLVMTRMI